MKSQPVVLALGMFDGVHIGHRFLLKECVRIAKKLGAQPIARSFFEHPKSVFGDKIPILNRSQERIDIIESLGVRADFHHFSRETARMSPEEYVFSLVESYNLSGVVIGYDHKFGRKAQGDRELMKTFAARYGFELEIVTPVQYNNETVSSSRIRAAIADGDLEQANAMLGAPYFYCGQIVRNKQIGRELGFPTINLDTSGKALPKLGVYAATAQLGVNGAISDESLRPAVCNIGCRPTFDDGEHINIETHILDLDASEDLYGLSATVKLQKFIRPEKHFDSMQALSAQIGEDCRRANEYFETMMP